MWLSYRVAVPLVLSKKRDSKQIQAMPRSSEVAVPLFLFKEWVEVKPTLLLVSMSLLPN